MSMNYYTSLPMHWLDNIPKPDGLPGVARPRARAHRQQIEKATEHGYVVVGDPDDCAKAVQQWVDMGVDQICFSPTTNTLPRRRSSTRWSCSARGHPAVRQGPGAPQHPHARGRLEAPSAIPRSALPWAGPGSGGRRADRPVPATFNFADIWEAVADLGADRVAVVCGDRRTYAELEERANRLAHCLADPASGPATTSASTSRTAPSTSRPCWPASRSGPSRSTSTTGTWPTSCATCSTTPTSSACWCSPSSWSGWPRSARPARRSRGASTVGDDYEAAAGRVVGRAGDFPGAAATTTTSSTPAAPPACPRAWCGGRRTRSTPASAAATRSGRRRGRRARRSCSTDHRLRRLLPARGAAHARRRAVDALSWLFSGGTVVLIPGSLDPARSGGRSSARGQL